MANPKNEPHSLIGITKPVARVVVRFRNVTVVDKENALVVIEPGQQPVFYLPKRDVDLSVFVH